MAGRKQLLRKEAVKKAFELPLNYTDPAKPHFLPQQSAFIHNFEDRFQFYVGGLGNGKTSAGVVKAYNLSVMFPGNMGYIGRLDGKELTQTTMTEFFRLIPEYMYSLNKQMGHIKFKPEYGGSEIFYGDLKKEEWASSLNLGWFMIDQAEEIDEARWVHGVSRLRRKVFIKDEHGQPLIGPDGKELVAPTYGFCLANPEGTDSFLYRYAHPDSPERKDGYKMYHATSYDGLAAGFVKQDYIDGMLAVFSEQARKRYLDGEWGVFSGRVYPLFDPATHGIESTPLDPSWDYYVSIDHGLTNPTSIGVWAYLPNGIRIRIREHYEGGGKPVSYHAACLRSLISDLPKAPSLMIADPAIWASNQSSKDHVFSIADEYNTAKVFPVPGQNDWNAGFNKITQALQWNPSTQHPITGIPGCPHLLYVKTACRNFEREMQNYKWKKVRGGGLKNSPDEPIDYNDHACDETLYFFNTVTKDIQHESIVQTVSALDRIQAERNKHNPLLDTRDLYAGSWMSY